MGLFSTNRFSSLSAEYVEEQEKIKEEGLKIAEEAVIEESETPEVISESTYFESVDANNEFTGLIETCIQIHENDNNVFNSLLELDFITSMNEQMLMMESTGESEASNAAKKQNIINQIDKVISGTREAVKQQGNKLSKTAGKMLKSDSGKYNKYIDAIKKNGIEGFSGINNFTFPSREIAKIIDQIPNLDKLIQFVNRATSGIEEANDMDGITSNVDELKLSIDSLTDDYIQAVKKALPKSGTWNPTSQDITVLINYTKGVAITNSVVETTKAVISDLDKIENICKQTISKIVANDERAVLKIESIYRCASAAAKLAAKKYNAYYGITVREIASYRRALLSCGRYALKKNGSVEESVEVQEMMNYVLGESSDLYIFEKFGY